jgi:hypothetical protein
MLNLKMLLLCSGIDKIIEMAAFPEVRALATAARNTLIKAGGGSRKVEEVPEEVHTHSLSLLVFLPPFQI